MAGLLATTAGTDGTDNVGLNRRYAVPRTNGPFHARSRSCPNPQLRTPIRPSTPSRPLFWVIHFPRK